MGYMTWETKEVFVCFNSRVAFVCFCLKCALLHPFPPFAALFHQDWTVRAFITQNFHDVSAMKVTIFKMVFCSDHSTLIGGRKERTHAKATHSIKLRLA